MPYKIRIHFCSQPNISICGLNGLVTEICRQYRQGTIYVHAIIDHLQEGSDRKRMP